MAKTDKVQRGVTPPPQDFHALASINYAPNSMIS
jgi:hypothetical protein